MKSIATTALAALMLLGTVSAIAGSKNSKTIGFSDGGPVPLCDPMTTSNCPSPVPTSVKTSFSDGGPVPLCDPMTTSNCPSPVPTSVR